AGARAPQPDDGPGVRGVADLDIVDHRVVCGPRDQPAHVGGEVAGAGQDPESIAGEPRGGHVRDDAALRVAELRVDRRSDGSIDVVRGGSLEQLEGTRTRDLDLAERREVDEPDTPTNGAVLLPYPIEPFRPGPAALPRQTAGTRPRPPGPMQVGTLPARLRPEQGARVLQPPVERGQAARATGDVGVVREAQPVVVAVGLAGETRREHRVAIGVGEAPG